MIPVSLYLCGELPAEERPTVSISGSVNRIVITDVVWFSSWPYGLAEDEPTPKSTALPSPFASFRSPDMAPTTHQVSPLHGSAFLTA